MGRDTAAIVIGIGIEIIVTIFGVVVKVMPIEIAVLLGLIGLAFIIWGVISFIRGDDAYRSLDQKIDRLLEGQSEVSKDEIDGTVGIMEAVSGKLVLIKPTAETIMLGDVCRGSKQTFSGIDIDGTFSMKILNLGYAAITPIIGNSKVEVDFIFDIKNPSMRPITLTVGIGGKIYFSQYIPAWGKGIFKQKCATRIDKQTRDKLVDMTLELDVSGV